MLNLFLLFHKCGNNFMLTTERALAASPGPANHTFVESVTREQASTLGTMDQPGQKINVRCRNFGIDAVRQSGVLDDPDARCLLFTRDPAGFVLSVTRYHLRGSEAWAVKKPLDILGGKTLTKALQEAADVDEQYIISMKVFRELFENMVSLLPLLEDCRVRRIRCEELFTTTSKDYFYSLAEFLRLEASSGYAEAMMQASPAFSGLYKHSTGSFREKDPLACLGPAAQAYFDQHWSGFAEALR